jgi:hypothetical protein
MWEKVVALLQRLWCRQRIEHLEVPHVDVEVPPPPMMPALDQMELEWLRVNDRELLRRLRELELDASVLSRRHRTAGGRE